MKYTFKWATTWDQIWSEEFLSQWQQWMEESKNAHVFFHPTMVKAWVDTYLTIRDLQPMFCIANHEDMTVFFPMVLWRRNWKNAFENVVIPVGYSDFDYHDPIVIGSGDISWENFWDQLFLEIHSKWKGDFDCIEIDGIRRTAIGSSKQWEEVEVCPYLDLSSFSNIDEFLNSLKRNLRQDTKRRVRRLEESNTAKFEVFGPDEVGKALETLPEMLIHHRLRWPNAYKASEFHENLVKALLPAGLMHFSRIVVDSKPISWRIGFMYKERYYSYMPAFDESYKQYSPGKVHLLYCIDDAIKRGIKVYDQLRGAELYKSEWTQTVDAVYTYNNVNDRWKSKVKEALIRIKHAIK